MTGNIILAILCWVMVGTFLLMINTNKLSKIAVEKFTIKNPLIMLIYVPLWWLIGIFLIIIYPALYLKRYIIDKIRKDRYE